MFLQISCRSSHVILHGTLVNYMIIRIFRRPLLIGFFRREFWWFPFPATILVRKKRKIIFFNDLHCSMLFHVRGEPSRNQRTTNSQRSHGDTEKPPTAFSRRRGERGDAEEQPRERKPEKTQHPTTKNTRRDRRGKETRFLRPKGAKRYQPGASPQVC